MLCGMVALDRVLACPLVAIVGRTAVYALVRRIDHAKDQSSTNYR
jgi:hypothetical protein